MRFKNGASSRATPLAVRRERLRSARLGLSPLSMLLEHRLAAVTGMAGAAQILGIEEREPIAVVLSDVNLRAGDVIDVGRCCRAITDDCQLAKRIAGKDEWDRMLAPGHAVVEALESSLPASAVAVLARAQRSILVLMEFTIG